MSEKVIRFVKNPTRFEKNDTVFEEEMRGGTKESKVVLPDLHGIWI